MTAPAASQPGTSGAGLPPGVTTVRHLARHEIMGLTSTFLLGMAVNLIGLPSRTGGTAHIASIVFLAAHVLIAVGLAVGSAQLLHATARTGRRWRRQAMAGAAAIALTAAAGILNLLTASNWWSYAMAAGFVAAFLSYGALLVQASALPPAGPEAGKAG